MIIRRAETKDIPQILKLLSEVLEIHAKIRPDVFNSGSTKYTEEELQEMMNNENNLIYVATENDLVLAYAFCELKTPKFTNTMKPMRILYIDDFCVDEELRGKHIGRTLFDYVKKEAKKLNCQEIVLTCWEGNDSAKEFYEKMGLKVRSTTMEYIIK